MTYEPKALVKIKEDLAYYASLLGQYEGHEQAAQEILNLIDLRTVETDLPQLFDITPETD